MKAFVEVITLDVKDVITTSTVVCQGDTCPSFDPFA